MLAVGQLPQVSSFKKKKKSSDSDKIKSAVCSKDILFFKPCLRTNVLITQKIQSQHPPANNSIFVPHFFIFKCCLVIGVFFVDTTSVADTRNNPSIGEGSVGGLTGSLSASGSHMDRLGAIRDNLSETASTMALAGASITGSLSGSAMVNYLNR